MYIDGNLGVFYIDRDYYLLDSSFYYLVDKNGNNVRLEEKHINMLRNSNILE